MRKILAIDDQLDNLITIKAVIKMLLPNYEVLMAQSGKDGLRIARQQQPEIILLDIIMPGMDGYVVCEELKKDDSTKNIPVIIITAIKTDSDSKVKALELGADAFVTKPFEPVELVAQLKVLLRTKVAEDKLREEKAELDLLVKERTKVLVESEHQYRMLVENTKEPIIVVQKGIIQFVNPIACELSEYNSNELIGSSFIQFLHPNDKDHILQSYKERIATGEANGGYEIRTITKSGKELWFSFKVNALNWQNEPALLYIFHNTTQQKEIERQKRKDTFRSEILLDIHKKAYELNDEELYRFILDRAVAITESEIGFFHGFEEDSKTIMLNVWNDKTMKHCTAPYETHYDIDKAGNWVDCIKQKKPVVYNDFKNSPNQKGVPQGHVNLKRYMSIPVMKDEKVSYIFGIGNKEDDYTETDVNNVQLIANEVTQILEKRSFENALKESEAKYRSFAEHFNGIAFRGFKNYGVDFINGKVEEITGYSEEDFTEGKIKFDELIFPDDLEKVANKVKEFVASNEKSTVRNYRIIDKNKEVKWIRESITKFEEEHGTGVYGILQDVTQERKTSLLLEETNRFNKTLLETIPFPMEIVSKKGDILFMNSVLEDMVGKNKLGTKCWELHRDDKKQCEVCPLKKDIVPGETNTVEVEGVFKGRAFDVVHKSMLFNGEMALMEIFIETTERKKFEREIIAAKEKAQESDRLKTAFLANMSHEIRTPMNGILGFTNLLREPGLTGEDQNRYIDIISRSGNRMLNTVNDIIEISKIETGQVVLSEQKVNIREHLQNLFQFFELEANNKGLKFYLENKIAETEDTILTDKNKLSSILSNLIKNALKFTEKGFVRLSGECLGDKLVFYVQDTGIGIPQNRLEAIFNRFEQADIDDQKVFEGSGLGLAISKSYAEMLGGKIWVESKPDIGSTFYFSIPYITAVKQQDSSAEQNSESKRKPNNALSILVAEDDEISQMHLKILLKDFSSNVSFVDNGKDAVAMCQKNENLDVILMDIKLPELDGLEATRQIRKFNSNVFIIAQTAFALQGDREKALAAGCNDYLSKPINVNRLKEILEQH